MELHRMTHEERPAGRALYRRSFPARDGQLHLALAPRQGLLLREEAGPAECFT